MRKVAVFFGGKSYEHEISILTGVMVLNLLDKFKYTVFPVYVDMEGGFYTSPAMFDLNVFKERKESKFQKICFDGGSMYALNLKKCKMKPIAKIDVALNCCHGGWGEGGGVSALMELNSIPLASPDVASSGVFMDKNLTKLALQALNIPTVDYIRVNETDYRKRASVLLKRIELRLKYPVIIKPSRLGSSIGIVLARNETDVKDGLEKAFALDDRVIIEKYLPDKKDVNCAAYVRGGEIIVSEPELAFGTGVYTFEEKYIKKRDCERGKNAQNDGVNYVGDKVRFLENERGMVALNGVLRDKIRAYTKTVYKRLNMHGVVRMDFLVCGDTVYLCEVNTVPGSLAYYLFCDKLMDARGFLNDLLEEAIAFSKNAKKEITRTNILNVTTISKRMK